MTKESLGCEINRMPFFVCSALALTF